MKGIYHLGLIRGTGQCKFWANGHRRTTVVLQARRNLDCLSPNLWRYLGPRQVTKAHLRKHKAGILTWINGFFGTEFTHIVVD